MNTHCTHCTAFLRVLYHYLGFNGCIFWKFWSGQLESHDWTKVQLISKCLFCALNSPKKWTKPFLTWGTVAVKSNFLVCLLGELNIPKIHFEINWPLQKIPPLMRSKAKNHVIWRLGLDRHNKNMYFWFNLINFTSFSTKVNGILIERKLKDFQGQFAIFMFNLTWSMTGQLDNTIISWQRASLILYR